MWLARRCGKPGCVVSQMVCGGKYRWCVKGKPAGVKGIPDGVEGFSVCSTLGIS